MRVTLQHRWLSLATWAAVGLLGLARHSSAADFEAWYVDHTQIEIAIAWAPVPGASSYVVWRDTAPTFSTPNLVSYTIEPTVTGFGDTGWPISDWRRFRWPSNPSESPTYHLDVGTDYYYQVVAHTGAGAQVSNTIGPYQITDYHRADEIVRGVAGDLWADAVLGKPSFAENTWLKTDPYHVQFPGGVAVDRRSSSPTHLFLVDSNHNRVLGLTALGCCSASQARCSIDTDCTSGETCTLQPGQMAPTFVLGQPSATDWGGCNGDATAVVYPNTEPPTASTLCLMARGQISTGETEISIQPVVDRNHNLYLPDIENSRVLMYKDPFDPANGTAALAVWGQTTFDAWRCNAGGPATMSSLCGPNSVDIDPSGHLWVADSGNNRVLRFPYNSSTGQIAKTADIALTGLASPNSVRMGPNGNLYVSDLVGMRKFTNPQPGGSNVPQTLTFVSRDSNYGGANQLAFDPTHPTHFWILIASSTAAEFDLNGTLIKEVHSNHMRGLDVSQSGDLFATEMWDETTGLYRLGPRQQPPSYWIPGDTAFLGYGAASQDSLHSVVSITTVGNQLLVSDRFYVHFWNDYHAITEGADLSPPSDGMWGPQHTWIVQTDTSGRIWMGDTGDWMHVFESPLTSASTPIRSFQVSSYKSSNGTIVPLSAALRFWKFIPVGSGDQMWFSDDPGFARMMRAVNIDGLEAPGQPPYVDIVLGQTSLQNVTCNQGRGVFGFARDTLCYELVPSLDVQGNLYVQDNATGGMDGGDTRLLRWNVSSIPVHPAVTIYDLLPDSVYGGGGPTGFTAPTPTGDPVYPYPANEIARAPRAPAFDASGRLVLGGGNPYGGPRFGMVYLNKEQSYQPQLALGDFVSFPYASHMDPEGNLYLADYDWCRVLVYKSPLAAFAATPWTPPPTVPRPSVTPTWATPTATPELTPASGLCTITTTGQTVWATAAVMVLRSNDANNANDGLQIGGQFTMATGTFSADPLANGAQLEIRSGSGAVPVSIALPAGRYRYRGPGWLKNRTGTKYTFTNRRPATTGGIKSMTVTSKGGGAVRVTIRASAGHFPLLLSDAPLALTIVLGDASAGAAGECGQTTLSNCSTSGAGTKLSCGH